MTDFNESELNRKQFLGIGIRAFCVWILGVLLLACAICVRVAPMTGHLRLLLATTFFFLLFTIVVYVFTMIGNRPTIVFPTLFFVVLFILWSAIASKSPDTDALRGVYYKRLRAFIGTPFMQGGETDLGIDCSGLARSALWHAMVRQGIKEFNPRLLGPSLWKFWWRDLSASDIDQGKYGYTVVIGYAKKLAGYDTDGLQIGDMAIADKSHVMIYYGKGQWIEASPVDYKVVVNRAPASSKREWFNEPVTLLRWRIFEKP